MNHMVMAWADQGLSWKMWRLVWPRRFVVLHVGFGLRGRPINFETDNLLIVLELCQSSVKRVLTWWSRYGEQPLVDPTHEISYLLT